MLPKNRDCVEEKTIKVEISPLLQIQLFPQTLVMELLLSGFNLLTLFPIILFDPAQPNPGLGEIHCSSWPKNYFWLPESNPGPLGHKPTLTSSKAKSYFLNKSKFTLTEITFYGYDHRQCLEQSY